MKKVKEILNKPISNVVIVFSVLIFSLILITSADLFSSSGLGGFLLVGEPLVAAVFGIGFYFVSRFLTKKNNWIITLICVTYLLYFSIDYYLK